MIHVAKLAHFELQLVWLGAEEEIGQQLIQLTLENSLNTGPGRPAQSSFLVPRCFVP